MRHDSIAWVVLLTLAALSLSTAVPAVAKPARRSTVMVKKVEKSESEWKALLEPERYRVLRANGTESAFTGAYWDHHAAGIYKCEIGRAHV